MLLWLDLCVHPPFLPSNLSIYFPLLFARSFDFIHGWLTPMWLELCCVPLWKTYDFANLCIMFQLNCFWLLLVYVEVLNISYIVHVVGLALLQKHGNLSELQTDLVEASHELMQEAAFLHPFAEACYTVRYWCCWLGHHFCSCQPTVVATDMIVLQGPLLDFGRNPILFPCAWVYRQGVLTPWARRRYVISSDASITCYFLEFYVYGSEH